MLCQLFKSASQHIDGDYVNALTEAVRPSVTVLADQAYKRSKVKVKQSVRNANGRMVETDVETVKVCPPSVPTSAKEIGSITTTKEKILLKALHVALVQSRTTEWLQRFDDPSLRGRSEQVEKFVRRTYIITEQVGAFVKERNQYIKSKCVARAKHMIASKEASTMAEAFTQELWLETAKEYIDQAQFETVEDLLRSIGFFDSDDDDRPIIELLARWAEM